MVVSMDIEVDPQFVLGCAATLSDSCGRIVRLHGINRDSNVKDLSYLQVIIVNSDETFNIHS